MSIINNYKKICDNLIEINVNLDSSYCNALRRIMISEVSSMAIEIVSISENNGLLKDEFIAHRLGLIPIRCNRPLLNEIKEIYFTMTTEHSNTTTELETIYSKELKITGIKTNNQTDHQTNFDIYINDRIIITKLGPGQKINLKAIAIKGIGHEHSKWSPCCGLSYKEIDKNNYLFSIETNYCRTPDEVFNEAVEILQNKLVKIENSL